MERPDPEIIKKIRHDYILDDSDFGESRYYHIRHIWSGKRIPAVNGVMVKIGKLDIRSYDIWYLLTFHDWPWERVPEEERPPRPITPHPFIMWTDPEPDDANDEAPPQIPAEVATNQT